VLDRSQRVHGRLAAARCSCATIERFDGETDAFTSPHREVGVCRETFEAAAGEKTDVIRVEDAAPVVVEAPERDACARVPVAEVWDARDQGASRVQRLLRLREQTAGLADMFEDVRGQDDVVVAADLGRESVFEICPR
jgi:hypothetical protein